MIARQMEFRMNFVRVEGELTSIVWERAIRLLLPSGFRSIRMAQESHS